MFCIGDRRGSDLVDGLGGVSAKGDNAAGHEAGGDDEDDDGGEDTAFARESI